MKTKINLLAILMFLSFSAFASSKTESVKVYGNCEMCKSRIEKAAKALDGVEKAEWNEKTKILEISFDDSKTSLKNVQMALAKIGHDTDEYRASDAVYNNLKSCCKYERPAAKKSKSKNADGTNPACKSKTPCCKKH